MTESAEQRICRERERRRKLGLVLFLGLIGLTPLNQATAQFDASKEELVLAMTAKIVGSAVFLSNRDPEDAMLNSAARFWRNTLTRDRITKVDIDRDLRRVTLTLDNGISRSAQFYGDQGCIICRENDEGIEFEPVEVRSSLPEASTTAWPMGDLLPDVPISSEVDLPRIQSAIRFAFADAADKTLALLVVHRGQLIAEQYARGIDKDMQLESWSMGKTITAALIGVLIQQEELKLTDYAPIDEWSSADDPRSKIRIQDLLRMSSGLEFSGFDEPPETWKLAHPDHFFIYSGAINAFDFSISRPLEHPPNTIGRYRNCDPMILGAVIKRTVTEMGEEYLSWPQRALFDRIGIRRQILETDPYGNFLMSGYDYGTARNWARIGMLFVNDGEFNGEQVMAKGFARFCGTPAPAWDPAIYGGFVRVNVDQRWQAPKDTMIMSGGGVSKTVVIPSLDLVVVRMGHLMGVNEYEGTFNTALGEICAAVESTD